MEGDGIANWMPAGCPFVQDPPSTFNREINHRKRRSISVASYSFRSPGSNLKNARPKLAHLVFRPRVEVNLVPKVTSTGRVPRPCFRLVPSEHPRTGGLVDWRDFLDNRHLLWRIRAPRRYIPSTNPGIRRFHHPVFLASSS